MKSMMNYFDINEMKIELIKIISNYEVKNDNDLLRMVDECCAYIYLKYNKEEERYKCDVNQLRQNSSNRFDDEWQ